MSRFSRSERRERPRSSKVVIGAVVVMAVAIALILFGTYSRRNAPSESMQVVEEQTSSAVATAATSAGASTVEVPRVAGMSIAEARLMLDTAGFVIVLERSGAASSTATSQTVTAQYPAPGVLSKAGASVKVTAPKYVAAAAKRKADESKPKPTWVVVIDPGHQEHSDATPEPIGPRSKKTKPSVSGGTSGVVTKLPEYELALQVSMNLKARLEAQGVKVVMTRTTNDVNLSNSERAAIANKAHADVFVRVHGDGSPDPKRSGISTLYPARNKWTSTTAVPSKRAAQLIQSRVVASTGSMDRGVVARGDLSGFNYARVPSVLVECGFMSNPVEDRLLSSPHYQDKLAVGIAQGVMNFLQEER